MNLFCDKIWSFCKVRRVNVFAFVCAQRSEFSIWIPCMTGWVILYLILILSKHTVIRVSLCSLREATKIWLHLTYSGGFHVCLLETVSATNPSKSRFLQTISVKSFDFFIVWIMIFRYMELSLIIFHSVFVMLIFEKWVENRSFP